jgi:hypothetical protein
MTRRQLTPLVCRNAQGIASPVPWTSRAEKRGTDPASPLPGPSPACGGGREGGGGGVPAPRER